MTFAISAQARMRILVTQAGDAMGRAGQEAAARRLRAVPIRPHNTFNCAMRALTAAESSARVAWASSMHDRRSPLALAVQAATLVRCGFDAVALCPPGREPQAEAWLDVLAQRQRELIDAMPVPDQDAPGKVPGHG